MNSSKRIKNLFCYLILNTINEGIIIDSKIKVYSAPSNSSTELFNINEGLKVDIENFENDWVRIKLIDGKDGWIQSNQILEI